MRPRKPARKIQLPDYPTGLSHYVDMTDEDFIEKCNSQRLWTDTGEIIYGDPIFLGFVHVYISIHPHVYCQIPAVLIERANSHNTRMAHYIERSNDHQLLQLIITSYLQYKLTGDKQYIERLWLTKLNKIREHLETCFNNSNATFLYMKKITLDLDEPAGE